MNQLSKQLLNEMMFEYYEGTLSPEKTMLLLDFLNNNPEYHAEFAAWSQTYALKHSEPEEYGLENILLRNRKPRFKMRWMFAGIAAVAAFSLYMFFNRTNVSSVQTNSEIRKKTIISNTHPVLKNTSSPLDVATSGTSKKKTDNTEKKESTSAENIQPEFTPRISTQEKTYSLHQEEILPFENTIADTIAENSITENTITEKQTKQELLPENKSKINTVKKKKGRLKVETTPGDIIKINPNF